MKKYEGTLICTDLDHTLICSDGSLSNENVEAIKYFMENGGMFTLCSGRPPLYLSQYHNMFIPNVPVICHNGATIYDYNASQYIRTIWLNDKLALEPLSEVLNNYREHLGWLCFYSKDYQYDCGVTPSRPDLVDSFIKKFSSMPKSKYLMSFNDAEAAHRLQMKFSAIPEYADVFEFSRSWNFGLECLPIDGNKGSGVSALKNHLGNVIKTVCVGDFENDISMLKIADIGYAVSNACDSVKEVASRITVSNDEAAIAKVISEL